MGRIKQQNDCVLLGEGIEGEGGLLGHHSNLVDYWHNQKPEILRSMANVPCGRKEI